MQKLIPVLLLTILPLIFLHQPKLSGRVDEKLPSPDTLLQDLACGNCHAGMKPSERIYQDAPSLSYAGLRYTAGYLFLYLEKPSRVRGHIGLSRMPDFRLDEKERLALTLFLIDQRKVVQQLPRYPTELLQKRSAPSGINVSQLVKEELKCTSCHKFQGEGDERAAELMDIGWRLNADWLAQYLALPQAFEPQTSMPAFFYAPSDDRLKLVEMIPNAGDKLLTLVAYLDSAGTEQRNQLGREFERTKKENPTITARLGEKVFVALNCAACHSHHSIKPWQNAPELSNEGKRVKRDWLAAYLEKPRPIRPFGYYPGTGSRMPDFSLTPNEAATMTDYFSAGESSSTPTSLNRTISQFSVSKAEKLLRDQLPCLGCHTLAGEGGKIGPDISHLSSRLRPEFVRDIIRDPAHTVLGSVMPRVQMTEKEQELISSYLLQRNPSAQEQRTFSLAETPLLPMQDTSSTAGLYRRYCAPCHGESGNGDGFNAKFLPVQAAKHSSKEKMSERADDTMFDGIHSGGAILNKNHRMPAFGGTLSREQIWALVRYIRELCQCEGPAWSRK